MARRHTTVRDTPTLLFVISALLLVLAAPALSRSAFAAQTQYPASATMNFDGAVNLLGLLSTLTVSPNEVGVRAAGSVRFVNNSSVDLALSVAGQSTELSPGVARSFSFPGASSAQRFSVSVTPLNVAVVGSAPYSSGTVHVAAASFAQPTTDAQGDGQPSETTSGESSDTSTVTKSAQAQATKVPGVATDPTAPRGGPDISQRPGRPLIPEALGTSAQSSRAIKKNRHVAPEQASTVSALTQNGQLGLLILIAGVLLAGVTSAAIRVIFARRIPPVRA
ncbi:MAG: hypothetical protein DLM55_04105 [Acidimicrobiales bacterium]|nr:MAG: hypothetical protein DLM55_04105 [Acidimicrobiales bacterium]